MRYSDTESFYKNFGKRLRELRKAKNLSQRELGLLCDSEKSSIQRIERGVVNCTFKTLVRIANALDITVSELVNIESTEEK